MTRSATVLGGVAALALCACEPSFVDVTYTGAPKCEGSKLTNDVVVKIEGPRASSMLRLTGDGAAMAGKLVAGKLYKVKAYKCVSEPCESPANLFHGEEFTSPEGKAGTVALTFPGAPACVPLAPAETGGPDAG